MTSINVSGKSIADLTGIQHFTALTELYCQDNQLTALDLSANTALTTLHCYSNSIYYNAMQALIESLPSVGSGTFVVKYRNKKEYYKNSELDHTEESWDYNTCTESQRFIAKNKGWNVMYHYVENRYNWEKISYDFFSSWVWQWQIGPYYLSYSGESDPASTYIAINEENFPDANFRNWLLAQSYGSDGKLSLVERWTRYTLDVREQNIANLKGIEFFTELRKLYCYDNQITVEAMQWLVENLPEVESGKLRIDAMDKVAQTNYTNEQIAIAKGKGWKVWKLVDSDYEVAGNPFDVNGDGVIDPLDAKAVKNYYLNQE